jgi:hypothetical protein
LAVSCQAEVFLIKFKWRKEVDQSAPLEKKVDTGTLFRGSGTQGKSNAECKTVNHGSGQLHYAGFCHSEGGEPWGDIR